MSKRILAAALAVCLLAGAAHAQLGIRPPANAPSKPAAEAPGTDADNPGVKAVEQIFVCMAAGLPGNWTSASAVITEVASDGKERSFEGRFFFSHDADGGKPRELVPCSAQDVARGVYALNQFLELDKRGWKAATLTFTKDGKFELKYDYAP